VITNLENIFLQWTEYEFWVNCTFNKTQVWINCYERVSCAQLQAVETGVWAHVGLPTVHLAENVRRGVVPSFPPGSTASHPSITNPWVHTQNTAQLTETRPNSQAKSRGVFPAWSLRQGFDWCWSSISLWKHTVQYSEYVCVCVCVCVYSMCA